MVKHNYSKQRSWSRLYGQLAFLAPLSLSTLPNLAGAHPLFAMEKVDSKGVWQQQIS